MDLERAVKILREGGAFVDLAESIGRVATDLSSSIDDLLLGLNYPGFVAEQAALALYARTGRVLPMNRHAVETDANQWRQWLLADGAPAQRDLLLR